MAAVAHGSAHVTVDLDIVYRRTVENIARLASALAPWTPRPSTPAVSDSDDTALRRRELAGRIRQPKPDHPSDGLPVGVRARQADADRALAPRGAARRARGGPDPPGPRGRRDRLIGAEKLPGHRRAAAPRCRGVTGARSRPARRRHAPQRARRPGARRSARSAGDGPRWHPPLPSSRPGPPRSRPAALTADVQRQAAEGVSRSSSARYPACGCLVNGLSSHARHAQGCIVLTI